MEGSEQSIGKRAQKKFKAIVDWREIMKKLMELVVSKGAKIQPASSKDVNSLEENLGFVLSDEYKDFLSTFGIIVYKSNEVYGLGVPDDYYLNVKNKYDDLRQDAAYPKGAVPLLEVGDGQYYLYDNKTYTILLWATPHGGIVRTIGEGLEDFLIRILFGKSSY